MKHAGRVHLRGHLCPHAVCWTHGQEFLANDPVIDIEYRMAGRILRAARSDKDAEPVIQSASTVTLRDGF
jgi:hypothetical protein